jgi:hypothetical protein
LKKAEGETPALTVAQKLKKKLGQLAEKESLY